MMMVVLLAADACVSSVPNACRDSCPALLADKLLGCGVTVPAFIPYTLNPKTKLTCQAGAVHLWAGDLRGRAQDDPACSQ